MDTTAYGHPALAPMELGIHRLRNRLVVAPMSRVNARIDGIPTKEMADYYAEYVRGGFGLIITEGIYTDAAYSQAYTFQPGLVTSAQMEGWKQVTGTVHRCGGVIVAQLMHAGALSQCLSATIAPSAVQPIGRKMKDYGGEGPFGLPREMNEEDILVLKEGYIKAGLYALAAGFNGVEIHAANGYLLDQLLTPHLNLRTDRYGGNVENRCRLIGEIIAEMRAVLPPEFIIGVRLSEGKVNDLGYRWPEGAMMARKVLEFVRTMPVGYVHIAAEQGDWRRDCRYADGSSYSGLARSLVGVPVIANGGLDRLDLAAEVLEKGHGDLLAIGKAALEDPYWPGVLKGSRRPGRRRAGN